MVGENRILKASTILIKADPTIQTRNTYTVRWNNVKKKADLYCAMGLLACKTGMMGDIGRILGSLNEVFINNFGASEKEMNVTHTCPVQECVIAEEYNSMCYAGGVSGMVIHLNDRHSWSFKQIGNWLKGIDL